MSATRIIMMSVAVLAVAGCQPKSESEGNQGGDKVNSPTEQPAMTNSMDTNNPSRPATNAPSP